MQAILFEIWDEDFVETIALIRSYQIPKVIKKLGRYIYNSQFIAKIDSKI